MNRAVIINGFAAASIGVLAAGCMPGTSNNNDQGEVQVALTFPGSVTVDAVSWMVLSSTNAVLASGTIDTSADGSTASVAVGIPPGTGDTVTMTAMTSTGATCTGTSGAFNVTAGTPVPVPVTITCGQTMSATSLGAVEVKGTVVVGDNCPVLSQWVVSPQVAAANGGMIAVSAAASDADVGETLTYSWTATSGTFADAASDMTTFVCGAAGNPTLSVMISDNHTPTACSITATFPPVTCQ